MTKRELEFVRLSAQGCTTFEIAEQVSRSHRTVQKALDNAIKRVRARNKFHLIALAVARGWVDGEEILREFETYKKALPEEEEEAPAGE